MHADYVTHRERERDTCEGTGWDLLGERGGVFFALAKSMSPVYFYGGVTK